MLNVSVKAVPLGNSKWDLIGAGSGSYYGTVHHESLVQRLTAPSQMALAPTLTISEHLDEVQKEINKLVTQVAKKVVAQWTTIKRVSKPKLDDPIKFRSLTEECIVEAFPDGALTSIALYTNTLILQMVNVLIADLGIDPENPFIPLSAEEQAAKNVPPAEHDESAIALVEALIGDCPYEIGEAILNRALEYLSNINEVLDILRLNNPGESTSEDYTIAAALKEAHFEAAETTNNSALASDIEF
jgi:hypothetical protein